MKRILCVLLTLLTVLTLAGCGAPKEVYDVDLTGLAPGEVYDAVFDMLNNPHDYEGKRIRVEGIVDTMELPDRVHYACLIVDAAACCPDGMEFVLSDGYAYPDDYPAKGETVTVSGYFHLYEVGEFLFCDMIDCELER